MKRKSLLIMLLVALFVPLAMNAQTQRLRKNVTRAPRTQLQLEVAGQLQTIEDFQPGVIYNRAAVNNRDNVLYSENFDGETLEGISIVDNDEDGNNWGWYGSVGVDDTDALASESWNSTDGALTPDNWVIFPAVTLPTSGSCFASVYAKNYNASYSETMGIWVAPENDDYIYHLGEDFTLTSGSFVNCEADLSAYAGQTVQVVIRHYNCTDGTYLIIDDFSIYSRVAEEEVTIGSGESNSSTVPTNTRNNYSLTQQIYTATEIGHTDGGNITSVSFYSTGNSTRTLDIYMVNTTMTTTTTSSHLTPTSSNKVVNAQSVSFTANAWTKITFDTPFEYTGGNVALIVDDNTGSSSGNTARSFRVFSATSQATYVNGNTNYDATSSSTSYSRNQNTKNQVKFTIQAAPTPVESITASDLSLTAGFSAPIDYTVLPADATNPTVTFTSANTSVATVSASGVVTGVAAGSTTITLTSVSNPEVSTTINVVVDEFVGLIFDFETDPNTEDWTFVDSDGDGYGWGWDYYETESGNSHMTPYENNGSIYSESYHNNESGSGGTALTPDNWAITPAIHILNSPSDVYLFAQGQDANYAAEHFQVYIGTSPDPTSMTAISDEFVATGSYLQYSANIPDTYAGQIVYLAIRHFNVSDMFVLDVDYLVITNAELAPDGILVESISADDVEVVVGGTANITNLEVLPADATNPAVTYTSNDETIATVENGVVTGVAPGTTTITIAATDGSNVSTTINVTVTGIDVTGITADDVEVATGETATITYTVAPANASDQSVTFTSANTAIATVDANGEVTGVAAGTTTITLTSVSNPEVETTINVTVTSNPNAAQFTVNAPATARPGQTITVEGVLAAPTSGTWGGFTDLAMGIYYDNTAFEYVANSMAYGPVAQQAQQLNSFMTPNTTTDAVLLGINCFNYGSFVTAEGVVFSAQFTVLDGAEGEYTFTAQPNNAGNFDHEGVLIPYEFTPSTVNITTVESYTKHIIGWNSGDEGCTGYNYYLIASPLAEDVDPSDVTNMIANTANEYDLYYFDQAGDVNGNEWINYKATNGGGYDLVNGKGYLYANKNTVDLIFTGAAPTDSEINVPLKVKDCSNASGHFVGWNLVGNPFGVTAYIDRDCYKMNEAGNEIIAGSGNSVEAMEGIFVIATTDGEEMTFSKTNSGSNSKVVLNVSDSQGLADRAIVRFGEGSQLPKFQLFGNSTKLYFPEDDQDYAVVRSANENELPVNFKASSNGSYTMSVNVEELDMDYLHLIDNMTGMDVDLLQTPSYTFEATTSDEESRFRLVFATVDGVNEHSFGFVNAGGNLCIYGIEGKATVQVIDVLGHVLSSENFSGSYEKHLDVVPGVYMVRLIQGNDVKVQKVVVR